MGVRRKKLKGVGGRNKIFLWRFFWLSPKDSKSEDLQSLQPPDAKGSGGIVPSV